MRVNSRFECFEAQDKDGRNLLDLTNVPFPSPERSLVHEACVGIRIPFP